MNIHKVKRYRNYDTKNRQQRTPQSSRLGTISNELLGEEGGGLKSILRRQTYELISTDDESVANKHCNDIVTIKFTVSNIKSQEKLPKFIGYINFINDLSKLVSLQTRAHVLTSCRTAIRDHWIF